MDEDDFSTSTQTIPFALNNEFTFSDLTPGTPHTVFITAVSQGDDPFYRYYEYRDVTRPLTPTKVAWSETPSTIEVAFTGSGKYDVFVVYADPGVRS